jgi:hypothetical protein
MNTKPSIGEIVTAGIGCLGTAVSTLNNPFVENAGFIKGAFAHLLVGAGTSLGAVTFGVTFGLVGGGILALAAGSVTDSRKATYAGALAGGVLAGIWGGADGYGLASRMLNQSVSSFKTAAIEHTIASSQPTPVRLTTEYGRPVATVTVNRM